MIKHILNLPIYNLEGEKTGTIKLSEKIFGLKINNNLIYQVINVQLANKRKHLAKVKDRGEVRGGGRKPWRQKGTGRARHGSIRSPLWKGGGVTFGPRLEKVLKKRIPKKMRIKALFMVLSAKAKENLVLVLDKLEFKKPKTKKMAEILNKLFLKDGSGLVVLSKMDKNLILSIRNIAGVNPIQAKDLNVLDLLSCKYVLISEAGIKKIRETFKI